MWKICKVERFLKNHFWDPERYCKNPERHSCDPERHLWNSENQFWNIMNISCQKIKDKLLILRHISTMQSISTYFGFYSPCKTTERRKNTILCILVLLVGIPIASGSTVTPSSAINATLSNRTLMHDGPLEFNDILPENPRAYDKMAPPRDVGHPTIVYFHVTVMSLDSIDESSMTYAADIFFAQSWKDWRLRLPDNMTHEYRLLPVHWLQDIWRPDSFFKNAKAVTFQERTIPNHYIWLYQDKTILYMVKLTLVLSCAMNFQVYPHDTQECSMKIESLSHTTDDLVFVWDPEVPLVVDRIELPQLDLVKNVTGDCTQVYSTGNFTCLEVAFTFKRRLGYYLFHTYIPTCLIVIMSWISFWIRPEAVPARVTLGVTSLLTLTTQHANSQKSLPPVSYIKAIDVFMSSCMVFVFCSLMEYALVNVVVGDVTDEMIKHKKGHYTPNITTFRDALKAHSRDCLGKRKSTEEGDTSPTRSRKSSPSGRGHSPVKESANGRKKIMKSISEMDSRGGGDNKPFQLASSSCFESASTTAAGIRTSTPLTVNIGLPPPPPPPVSHDKQITQLMKRRREKAILIDRFSRVMFPVSFTVLNVIYWSVFVIEWNYLFS